MDELANLEAKVDRLQNTMDMLIQYVVERDACSFMADVESNLYADILFEMIINPESFFDLPQK